MAAFGGASLSYDANENLTSDGKNTYTWDARNHLTAISGGATASFVYDGFRPSDEQNSCWYRFSVSVRWSQPCAGTSRRVSKRQSVHGASARRIFRAR